MTKKIRCLAETPEIDTVQEDVRRILPSVLDVFVELYFVSKCIRNCIRRKWGEKGGRFWAKMTGWVVSRPRKGGISFAKCCISFRKGGISQNREIVDTPTFPLFGLYMWYLTWKIFFQKTNFMVFRRYIVSFVSVCIRVVCTYITYIMVIFFLIILPRWIYNAVFF